MAHNDAFIGWPAILAELLDRRDLSPRVAESAITEILNWMAEQEKDPEPPPDKPQKQKKAPLEWVIRRGQRGRCPNWVLKQTGCVTKQELLRKYGNGFKFIEGEKP